VRGSVREWEGKGGVVRIFDGEPASAVDGDDPAADAGEEAQGEGDDRQDEAALGGDVIVHLKCVFGRV